MIKRTVAALLLFTLPALGRAEDKAMGSLTVGKSYLIRVKDKDAKCGASQIPITVLSYSERGDVMEISFPGSKETSPRWVDVAAVCDQQALRAEKK